MASQRCGRAFLRLLVLFYEIVGVGTSFVFRFEFPTIRFDSALPEADDPFVLLLNEAIPLVCQPEGQRPVG